MKHSNPLRCYVVESLAVICLFHNSISPMKLDPKVLRFVPILPFISLGICRRTHSVS